MLTNKIIEKKIFSITQKACLAFRYFFTLVMKTNKIIKLNIQNKIESNDETINVLPSISSIDNLSKMIKSAIKSIKNKISNKIKMVDLEILICIFC